MRASLMRAALSEAGGKGANLGELINAGLPVPSGFVVAASAYRALLDANGLVERIAGRCGAHVHQGRHGRVIGPIKLENLKLGERRKRQQQRKQQCAPDHRPDSGS